MSIGPAEIMVVLVVALMVVGPARLPAIAHKIGGGLRELRKAQATFQAGVEDALHDAETTSDPE